MTLIDRPIELTDPLKTWMSISAVDGWLSLEEGMWPDRAGELMGFVRRGYEATEDDDDQASSPAACATGTGSRTRWPRSSTTSTCC